MINVGELITDPDFAQEFNVYRSNGSFVDGVWTEGTPTQIKMTGVVTVMRAREIDQLPEGDRVSGGMNFHTTAILYVSREGTYEGISDKIYWRGNYYKLVSVLPYADYGYYKASGVRTKGA
jgi:hypothetical protein